MKSRRVSRLNSLLKEVISDVIRRDLKNPHLTNLLTVTDVEVTSDLQHAKVFISVIGNDAKKKETMDILYHAKGYIAVLSSKQVELRYFPQLQFILDDGVEKQMRIDALLKDIQDQQKSKTDDSDPLQFEASKIEDGEEDSSEDEESEEDSSEDDEDEGSSEYDDEDEDSDEDSGEHDDDSK